MEQVSSKTEERSLSTHKEGVRAAKVYVKTWSLKQIIWASGEEARKQAE